MEELRIKFVDFWSQFKWKWFFVFNEIIPKFYDVRIVDHNPDVLFFSSFGKEHLQYSDCKKIFYTAEAWPGLDEREHFLDCDYSFSFHYRPDDENHYRFPSWVFWRGYDNLYQLTQPRNPQKILNSKSKFCNFLYSNDKPTERKEFFKELSEYKKVDSAGSVLNNMDTDVGRGEDIEWTSNYKFNIAFENKKYPGYTTEKILRAFLAKTIPIYWGNPHIEEDFNKDAFINVKDSDDFSCYVEQVKELDEDDDKYKEMIMQPPFKNNEIPEQWKKETLEEEIKEVLEE